MRRIITVCIALLFVSLINANALAEKRVALVIGNSTYVNVPRLPNPANDAPAVADLFKKVHFDSVQLQLDAGIADLRRAVSDFAYLAADADIAVVYYAGAACLSYSGARVCARW